MTVEELVVDTELVDPVKVIRLLEEVRGEGSPVTIHEQADETRDGIPEH